jgi:hypothetical protein
MGPHIDELQSLEGNPEGGFLDRTRFSQKGHHGPVVILIGEIVEELGSGSLADFLHNLFDLAFIPPLAEIGDAFQDFHTSSFHHRGTGNSKKNSKSQAPNPKSSLNINFQKSQILPVRVSKIGYLGFYLDFGI